MVKRSAHYFGSLFKILEMHKLLTLFTGLNAEPGQYFFFVCFGKYVQNLSRKYSYMEST